MQSADSSKGEVAGGKGMVLSAQDIKRMLCLTNRLLLFDSVYYLL